VSEQELGPALERFAALPRVLVALDFDGTLAPLVDDPAAAAPLPRSVEAVRELTGLPGTSVAVVSGRSLDTLRELLGPVGPVGPVALVGSHGAEVDVPPDLPQAAGADTAAGLGTAEKDLLAGLREAVGEIVAAHPGTALEEKPAAVVLHTRGADRATALAASGAALLGPARTPGVYTLVGKEVVELAVTDVSKGTALRRLRSELGVGPGGVLYAGDDTTDEHAFAALDDDAGDLTLKIGPGATAARHRLAGPEELADLLAELARLRRGVGRGSG
jgi:trehalose-phosphatase